MLPPDCENTEKKSNATQDNAAVVYTSVADVAKLTAGPITIAMILFNAFSDRSKHGKAHDTTSNLQCDVEDTSSCALIRPSRR